MEITLNLLKRVQSDWNIIAGTDPRPLKMDAIKGTFYAFGTELQCLRLFHKYNLMTNVGKARAYKNPKNVNPELEWVFSLETNL